MTSLIIVLNAVIGASMHGDLVIFYRQYFVSFIQFVWFAIINAGTLSRHA